MTSVLSVGGSGVGVGVGVSCQVECNVVQRRGAAGTRVPPSSCAGVGDGYAAAGFERGLTELAQADRQDLLARFQAATARRAAAGHRARCAAADTAAARRDGEAAARGDGLRKVAARYVARTQTHSGGSGGGSAFFPPSTSAAASPSAPWSTLGFLLQTPAAAVGVRLVDVAGGGSPGCVGVGDGCDVSDDGDVPVLIRLCEESVAAAPTRRFGGGGGSGGGGGGSSGGVRVARAEAFAVAVQQQRAPRVAASGAAASRMRSGSGGGGGGGSAQKKKALWLPPSPSPSLRRPAHVSAIAPAAINFSDTTFMSVTKTA